MKRSLVRTLGLGVLALIVPAALAGQQTGTVTGTVTDAMSMQPLAGAQVSIEGTNRGALSTGEGRFVMLNVPAGTYTIRVELLGYGAAEQTATVTAGGTATVSFELTQQAIEVEGVVVTALGIEREERALTYSVQTVSAEALERTPEVNLVQALQAQSAGVQVVQSSGRPGASSFIQIRGQSTFTGSSQPLFIIDGVPVSIDLDPERGGSIYGRGQAGNRGMDFDMSNVEEISVLRGAAATALYGSRAAAGAVVIKTKQGRPGMPVRFEYSSSARLDDPIIAGYVTDWAAGRDRFLCDGRLQSAGGYCQPGYPTATGFETRTITSSGYPGWGPHKDSIPPEVTAALGDVIFEDTRSQFYQQARTLENSLRATGSLGDAGSYTFGVSYLDQGDITPTGKLERLNLSANVNLQMSDRLMSTTSVQRVNTQNPWPADSWVSVHHNLLHIPPNVDIRTAVNDDGTPVMWGTNSPHYQWVMENEYRDSNVNRWIVSQRFAAEIVPGVRLSNTWGLDTYLDERRTYQNERPWRTADGLNSGGTRQEKLSRTQMNNDLVLSVDQLQFGEDLTVSGLVGGNIWMTDNSRITGQGFDIVIPDYYNVENFQRQDVYAALPEERRLLGAYAQATVDYKGWSYFTLTGRNDWSSTLPKEANNYFYPSASVGVIFTDAIDWRPSWLQYGKVRLSYARVGADAPPYSLSSRYYAASAPGVHQGSYQFDPTTITFPFRGQVGFLQGTQLGNPDIRPESTSEVEVGLELRGLNNRASLDVSYYDKKSYDQIFSVPASASSGYTRITRNAGDLRNKGWEISVRGRPIQMQDFTFDLSANWTRNRNSVIELAPGIDNLHLAGYSWPSIRIMAGLPYGVIWGYGYQRNCMPETGNYCFPDQPTGALILGDENCASVRYNRAGDCHGLPIRTQRQLPLGTALPDWLANISSVIRYKGFGLSSLWDIRKGSQILNFEIQYTTGRNGRHILTNDRYSVVTLEGVNQTTGQPNTKSVVKDPTFYELMYGYDKHEGQIEPGGFIKLRQVTLSYDIPRTMLGRIGVDRATVYATGRNLGVWSDFSMGDPEADISGGFNSAWQYYRHFPAPQTRGYTFGVRTSF
ncbi:MAG: SusC/RagA family TonB-linked outer membrane protein [Gemmatimonadota bacterium]|nr:SusC/RagA family TonB-linked outer membrane protein [Gemmatimonadota bacterium]